MKNDRIHEENNIVTIDLRNFECDEFDEVVVKIDTWYDRHTRLWVTQKLNKDGFQIGDAVYTYGKKDAIKVTEELKAKYNI